MARIRQQQPQRGGEDELLEMLQMAALARQVSQPPEMDSLIRLLGLAEGLADQESDLAIRQQAVDVDRERNEIERQKMQQIDPSVLSQLLVTTSDPAQAAALRHSIKPEVYPAPEAAATSGKVLPDVDTGKKKGTPTSRKKVTSMKPFLGYEAPEGDFEAVLDELGKIMHFTRAGEKEEFRGDFVPSVESIGPWGASKYATAQQAGALGRMFGFSNRGEAPTPY